MLSKGFWTEEPITLTFYEGNPYLGEGCKNLYVYVFALVW